MIKVDLPEYIAVALERDWAKIENKTVSSTYGTGETNETLSPSLSGVVWLVYGVRYGQLDPAGPTTDFSIQFEHEDMRKYTDEIVHSTMDFEMPTLFGVSQSNRLKYTVTNDTGTDQTFDFQLLMVRFRESDLETWDEWFRKKYVQVTTPSPTPSPPTEEEEGGGVSPRPPVTQPVSEGGETTCKWVK